MRPTVFLCLLAGLLAGCASPTTPVPPCCYQGPVTTIRLAELDLRTEDGRLLDFVDAFPGYAPEEGPWFHSLPFDRVLPEDLTYSSLIPLVPIYDANGDGRLEKPEVLVLYAREAALATGTPVKHFVAGSPVWAISAPNADIGGLVRWVEAHRDRMDERGQKIFRDLEQLGRDLQVDRSELGPDSDGIQLP